MPRQEKEELLYLLEAKKAKSQQTKLLSYNNPDVVGADKVHRIQVEFHKDTRKVRLFLGGNRCLEEGTCIAQPNGRECRIEMLKPGDVVLAVDPETRQTLPVPVEAVYEQGEQRVFRYAVISRDAKYVRKLFCTPGHHILTVDGLIEAGSIPEYLEIPAPEETYYAGKYEPMAFLAGLCFANMRFENEFEPVASLSSSQFKAFKRHCELNKCDTYGKRDEKGYIRLYGSLAKYLDPLRHGPKAWLEAMPLRWDSQSLRDFISGWLPQKFVLIRGCWSIVCKAGVEAIFMARALRHLGLAPSRPYRYKQGFENILIFSPYDVLRLLNKLKLPKDLVDKLNEWASNRVNFCENSEIAALRKEHYWKSRVRKDFYEPPRTAKTYDIKLSGEHNLFIANGIIVGNSGKTEAGTVEMIWFLTGTHPHREISVPNNGRLLVESLEVFEQDILPKLKRWAPNFDKWEPIKGHQGKIAGHKLPNGSRYDVFTFNQESAKLEGTSIRWLWANEPPPEAHVIASRRGLIDQDGDLWFTLTPLSEPYLYNSFVVPSRSNQKEHIGVHYASIWDNPWLKKDAIKAFLDSLDPDERAAREKGEFRFLQGRVFKDFDLATHVIPEADWPPSWPVTIGIDPHLRKNHVATFLGLTKKGWYVVIDEVSCGEDFEEFGNRIIEKVRDLNLDIQGIGADSIINQPDMMRRDIVPYDVLNEIFQQAGLPTIEIAKKKNTKYPFISEMKRLLKVVEWPKLGLTKEGQPVIAPSFFIMERCQGLIKDFLNYVYKRSPRPEQTGPSEEPIKTFDDYLDALKYAFLSDPHFVQKMNFGSRINIETYTGLK